MVSRLILYVESNNKEKYTMVRKILFSALIAGTLSAAAREHSYNIIPEPAEIIESQGEFRLDSHTPIYVTDESLQFSAAYLVDYADRYLGLPIDLDISGITKKKKHQKVKGEKGQPGIRLLLNEECKRQGAYSLCINPAEGVTIKGDDVSGVFYAIQTLIQLLPVRAGVVPVLPALTVNDYPRFQYRGMHLDVVRHFFPVSYLKRYLDFMAFHKLNYFHWHLTDDQGWRIYMKSHPELTERGSMREGEIIGYYPGTYKEIPYGGFYTHDDVREVVAYAAERGITVIPEIDIPGHCMAVLAAHPEFSTTPDEVKKCALTWGIFNKFNNVLAPVPDVFRFLDDVFGELCDLFPGQYIHVGGDECAKRWWQESEQTQQFMREKGLKDEKELQSYFIHYVQRIVNAKGKTLIGWDEIMEGGISQECVVMNWRQPSYGLKAVKSGHRTIMTSSGWTYFNRKESRSEPAIVGAPGPLNLQKVYEYQVVPDSLTAAQAANVWGVQGCLWTEYLPTTWKAEFFLFPRMAALSENAWTVEEKKDWKHFAAKMPAQFDRYDLWGIRYSDLFFQTEDLERKR